MTHSPSTPPPSAPSATLLTWKNVLPWLLGTLGIVIVGSGLFFLIRQFNTATALPLFTPSTLDLASLLAPFVLLATVIERFWEGLFDLYERIAVQIAARLGVASPETAGLWTNLKNAEAQLASATDDESRAQALAEVRDARVALLDIYETPEYKGIKRGITTLGSLVIGVALCVSQRIGVFEAIGFTGIAPLTDVIFTGLLIGAGPGPMHSFISILQEFRDTIAGLGNYAQSQAWQNFKNAQYPQPVLASAPAPPTCPRRTIARPPYPTANSGNFAAQVSHRNQCGERRVLRATRSAPAPLFRVARGLATPHRQRIGATMNRWKGWVEVFKVSGAVVQVCLRRGTDAQMQRRHTYRNPLQFCIRACSLCCFHIYGEISRTHRTGDGTAPLFA